MCTSVSIYTLCVQVWVQVYVLGVYTCICVCVGVHVCLHVRMCVWCLYMSSRFLITFQSEWISLITLKPIQVLWKNIWALVSKSDIWFFPWTTINIYETISIGAEFLAPQCFYELASIPHGEGGRPEVWDGVKHLGQVVPRLDINFLGGEFHTDSSLDFQGFLSPWGKGGDGWWRWEAVDHYCTMYGL